MKTLSFSVENTPTSCCGILQRILQNVQVASHWGFSSMKKLKKKENEKQKRKNRTVLMFPTSNVACFEILVHSWRVNLRKSWAWAWAWAWTLILSVVGRHKPK